MGLTRAQHASFGIAFLVAAVFLSVVFPCDAGAQVRTWTERHPEDPPLGRDDHAMAFDSDHGVIVMFGGDHSIGLTWIWDGLNWRPELLPGPSPRREAAMVYDRRRKKILMWGGFDFSVLSTVTWEFDAGKEEWKSRIFDEVPPARADHAMAFDDAMGVTIMFGGDGAIGDTWSFDGEKWSVVVTEDEGPGPRWGHAMAYDSVRERVVMFGGVAPNGTLLDDTWEFDGERWVEAAPAGSGPPAMRDHSMAYDEQLERVVLFGGRDNSADGFNRTWEWDGRSWREINTPSRPSPRHELAAAYDSWRKQVVIFGGSSGDLPDNRFKTDTWVYPNNPPVITHAPVSKAITAQALSISAAITDYDEDAIDARVFYRTAGETEYRSAAMQRDEEQAGYVGVIPSEFVQEPSLEYFIRAVDSGGSGMAVFFASPDDPVSVIVGDTGTLRVGIRPPKARRGGAQWRIEGQSAWRDPGDMVELPVGSYRIRFRNIDSYKTPDPVEVEIGINSEINIVVRYRR